MDNDQPGGSSSRLNPVELIVPPSAGQSRPAPRIITMSSGTNIGSVSTNPIVTVEPAGIENPANVRNLRDILKFTTKMTADAATENNDVIDLTYADEVVEKKKFLKKMLSKMSVNIHEDMNNAINILLDSNKHIGDYEYAFDLIEEYIETIDYANDFQKLGGFQVFTPGLQSPHKIVRSKTAELIAALVQNNPYCQEKFFNHPTYMKLLMDLTENDPDDVVRIKALHAISCLVRQNVTFFWKFIDLGGINLVISGLTSLSDKLQVKSAFLIYSTCHLGNDVADMYVNNGVVEIICSIIKTLEKSYEDFSHDVFLSTLVQLLRMSPNKVKPLCTAVEDFKTSLLSLNDSYPLDDQNYQDEKDQILWLLETLTL